MNSDSQNKGKASYVQIEEQGSKFHVIARGHGNRPEKCTFIRARGK